MAAKPSVVLGIADFKVKLKNQKAMYARRVEKALSVAGLYLQRESQQLVPVDFGVLKASAFTRAEGKGFKTVVNVGYTAAYAMFVHEMPSGLDPGRFGRPREAGNPARGNFWDPAGRGQSKFLEQPSRTARPQLLKIIKNIVEAGEKK